MSCQMDRKAGSFRSVFIYAAASGEKKKKKKCLDSVQRSKCFLLSGGPIKRRP